MVQTMKRCRAMQGEVLSLIHISWAIAKELQVDLTDIGKAADALGIKICRCQLGCF